MLDQFRKYEGAEQRDFWDEELQEEQKQKRAFKLACAAVLGFVVLILALPAMAEETTSPPGLISGGVICDTLEDAKTYIENKGVDVPKSCGILRGQLLATVTLLEKFEMDGHVYSMARYDFLQGPLMETPQYGWWGNPIKLAGFDI